MRQGLTVKLGLNIVSKEEEAVFPSPCRHELVDAFCIQSYERFYAKRSPEDLRDFLKYTKYDALGRSHDCFCCAHCVIGRLGIVDRTSSED